MDEQHKIFFQTLLNTPSITPSQIKKINKLRVEESEQEEIVPPKIPNNEFTYDQPRNVTRILSKFNKGNDYGIILHPNPKDSSEFGKSIENIQRQLIKDLTSISIPKTLKAFLSVFILGKYGPYKEWVGFDKVVQNLTCDKIIKEHWCKNKHPLRCDETKESFRIFAQAIRVDGWILNTIIDKFEAVYCQPKENIKKLRIASDTKNKKKTSRKSSIKYITQRTVERHNLDKANFPTYTRIFFSAIARLLTIIVKHTSPDERIFIGYQEQEKSHSIIIKHSYLAKNSIISKDEIDAVKHSLPKILTGYGELTVEGDFRKSTRSKKPLPQKHYIVKASDKEIEKLDTVENGTTYRINFFQ